MEVPGVSPGATGAERAMAARDVAPPAVPAPQSDARAGSPTPDSVAGLLRELSQADLTRLIGLVEVAPKPGQESQVALLLEAAAAAVAERNPGFALEQLRQLAAADPKRAESLASEPALASIRPAVEQMLHQLTGAAKLHAEGRLAEATRGLEPAILNELVRPEVSPDALLMVAARLIEAGGLANYVRSAAVSGVAIDQARWAPAPHAEPVPMGPRRGESRLPMRLLIMGWVAAGVAGAALCWWLRQERLAFVLEVWGGGVLVLACVGAWQLARRC